LVGSDVMTVKELPGILKEMVENGCC